MKKTEIQKAVFKKHTRKFKDTNSSGNFFPEYLSFDLEFILEYPVNNIFKSANERVINKEVTSGNNSKSNLKNIK